MLLRIQFLYLKVRWQNLCITAGMQKESYSPEIKAILSAIMSRRNELGYTQEYIGYKLGMSQNAYSKIELGYTNITVNHLFKIAEILECRPHDLIKNV